ncbi:hypothetical protein MX850_00275 [Erysipelothrix sp. Poltava]|nr:hypothetical protein MX850_00275 [Erysipelothrix sp. Poltava]
MKAILNSGDLDLILEETGTSKSKLLQSADEILDKLPKVQGAQLTMDQEITNVFAKAQAWSTKQGDTYISLFALFLGILEVCKYVSKSSGLPRD